MTQEGIKSLIFGNKGKMLGALIGYLIGLGFIGIILGLVLGHILDYISKENRIISRIKKFYHFPFNTDLSQDIQVLGCTIALSVKALLLGKSLSPLEKNHYISEFSNAYSISGRHKQILNTVLNSFLQIKEPDINGICTLYSRFTSKKERHNILYLIYKNCKRDINQDQRDYIINLARNLEILEDYYSLFETTIIQPEDYKILGVTEKDDLNTIKQVYRKLASQFHPDSISLLSETQKREANEAFVRIKESYIRILKSKKPNTP